MQVLNVAENLNKDGALTWEAFQIDAITKRKLTNVSRSTYYEAASIMLAKGKREVVSLSWKNEEKLWLRNVM